MTSTATGNTIPVALCRKDIKLDERAALCCGHLVSLRRPASGTVRLKAIFVRLIAIVAFVFLCIDLVTLAVVSTSIRMLEEIEKAKHR
jgi:hypothetical protein